MKDSRYFPHDNNSYIDEKIIDLRIKHGVAGYGVFWAIIELLHQNNGKMENSSKRIAFALQLDEQLVASVIKDFNLFESDENYIFSKKLLEHFDKRKQISDIRKRAGSVGGLKRQANANQMPSKIKQSKVKESKVNKKKVKSIYSTPDILVDKKFQLELAEKFPNKNVPEEIDKMLDWLASTGKTKKDYAAFARNWIRNSIQTTEKAIDWS